MTIFSCPWDIDLSLFMLCMPCPGDIQVPLHFVSKLPVCKGAWMRLIIFSCHRDIFQWIEIDNIFMSPGHLSVPVHAMHAMSQGHTGTFTFGFTTPRLSRRMDWDWQYFHVPGTSIILCSCYACHVPGTYRYPLILFQNSPFVKAHGFRLIIFSCPRDIYQSLFMLCMHVPGTYRYLYVLFQNSPFVKAHGLSLIICWCSRDIYQSLFMLYMPCLRDIQVRLHSVSKLPVSRRMDWDW